MKKIIINLIDQSQSFERERNISKAWKLLEEAHILSQPFPVLHTKVHWNMLVLAFKTNALSEIWGQLVRLFLAAPGSLFEKYPRGNTGRSNVSMFVTMSIPENLEKIILESKQSIKRSSGLIFGSFLFSILLLFLGYISFGFWVALIFTFGFMGGFIIWLFISTRISWDKVRLPFWITFTLFILHRIEEKIFGFFALLSKITEIPTPDIITWNIILLVLLSVGAWLFVPILVKRGVDFGNYLLWTFLASMGVTELAHLIIFPFFTGTPYGYFPGMVSAVPLVLTAWWGMFRAISGQQE